MRFYIILATALAVFFSPNFFRADWDHARADAAVEETAEPRLVAAMFRSSWCSSCRILEPRIEDIRPDYEDSAVEFIKFDFTLGRRGGLRERAEEEGIVDLFDQLEGRTGFLVLMDRETGQVFEIVTMAYDRDNIRAALDRWLGVVDRL